jgi:hypothetical protein
MTTPHELWAKGNELYILRMDALTKALASKYLYERVNADYEEHMKKTLSTEAGEQERRMVSQRYCDLATEIDVLNGLGDLTKKEKAILTKLEADFKDCNRQHENYERESRAKRRS